MNYICQEKDLDRETIFSFIHPQWSADSYVDFYVARISDGIGIHRVEIKILNNKIQWQEYHLREDQPFTTPKVRSIIEKIWKLKAFL